VGRSNNPGGPGETPLGRPFTGAMHGAQRLNRLGVEAIQNRILLGA
jgi:hypothetical protein